MRFIALVAAAVFAAPAQDACKLELKSAKGQKVTVSESKNMNGSFTITAGGQEQAFDTSEKAGEKYVDEVLAVDESGWPVEVKRSIREWWEEAKRPNDPEPERVTSPLEGRTVTLKLRDRKTTIEGADKVEARWTKSLKLKKNVFIRSFPAKEIPVGTTWTIDGKDLIEDFEEDQEEGNALEMKKGSATGALKEIAKGVAKVVYDVRMEGEMYGGVTVTIQMTVTARIDCAKHRMVSLDGEGTMTFDGEMHQGDQKLPMKGSMKLQNSTVFSYE